MTPARIVCSPAALDFGELSVPDGELAAAVVTCENLGEDVLFVHDLEVSGSPEFTLSSISSIAIQGGGAAQFSVTYTPDDAGTDTGSILLESSDPSTPFLEIGVSGVGLAPGLSVSAGALDFGEVPVGCVETDTVVLTSTGNVDLSIEDVVLSVASSELSVDTAGLPEVLAPGESAALSVDYSPFDETADAGYLTILSDDPVVAESTVGLSGAGTAGSTQRDVFSATVGVDVLFAVDTSASLADDVATLGSQFGAFTDALDAAGMDYRVALVVQDSGEVYGSTDYIDPTSSEDASDIAAEMLSGSGGQYTEMGFTLLTAALSANSDWLRESTELHLVGISDEPEQSNFNYSQFVSQVQDERDDPADVVVHAIGGDYPSGCGWASVYTGFYEATIVTGGLFLSFCDSWTSNLQALGEIIAPDDPAADYALSGVPVAESIAVSVDGVVVTDWTYDAESNAVVFDGALASGAEVAVDYYLAGACD